MIKYKLICCDLDDTLITSDARLTDKVIDAVRRYSEAGGRFCIVTGRMTAGAVPICEKLGLDTETATYQGAIITDLRTGKEIFRTALDTEEAAEIADYIRSEGYYCQTYIGNEFIMEKSNSFTEIYSKLSFARYRETGEPLGATIRRDKLRPPKLLVMSEPENIASFIIKLKAKYGEKFRINTSKPYIIEIIPKDVSKARAVEFIASRNGIDIKETICIGDSENDVPMIACAGLGVAVGNASDNVKSYADVIAPDCDSDGVAYVIDRYALSK